MRNSRVIRKYRDRNESCETGGREPVSGHDKQPFDTNDTRGLTRLLVDTWKEKLERVTRDGGVVT